MIAYLHRHLHALQEHYLRALVGRYAMHPEGRRICHFLTSSERGILIQYLFNFEFSPKRGLVIQYLFNFHCHTNSLPFFPFGERLFMDTHPVHAAAWFMVVLAPPARQHARLSLAFGSLEARSPLRGEFRAFGACCKSTKQECFKICKRAAPAR